MKAGVEGRDREGSPPSDLPPDVPRKILRRGVLGRRRRYMVLIVSMIGLSSFLSPLIRADSEVLGRTRWSPLLIVIELHNGSLPDCRGNYSSLCDVPRTKLVFMTLDATLGFGTAYAVLLAIVLAALLFPRAELIGAAGVIGAGMVLKDGQYGFDDLQDFLGHHAHGGALELGIVGILLLLIWISVTKALDY